MTLVQTEIHDSLSTEARTLIEAGWFRDEQDIFLEAIRRYLDAHRPEVMEQFLREDVEWGLHGDE